MSNKKKKLLQYLITSAVGLLLTAAVYFVTVSVDKAADYSSAKATLALLSDATLTVGILLLGVGLIAFAGRKGTFDSLGFAVESILVVRNWSTKRRFRERENYSQYRERKEEARKEKKGLSFFYPVGGGFLVLSIVLLIVYSVI